MRFFYFLRFKSARLAISLYYFIHLHAAQSGFAAISPDSYPDLFYFLIPDSIPNVVHLRRESPALRVLSVCTPDRHVDIACSFVGDKKEGKSLSTSRSFKDKDLVRNLFVICLLEKREIYVFLCNEVGMLLTIYQKKYNLIDCLKVLFDTLLSTY